MSDNKNRGLKLEALVNGKKEVVHPITRTKYVFDEDGNSLDDIISNKLVNIEDVDERISELKSELERKVHDDYLEKKKSEKFSSFMVRAGIGWVIAFIVLVLLLAFYVRNENRTKMEEAKKYYTSEEYEKALDKLEEINTDYKGKKEFKKKITYDYAKSLYEEGEYELSLDYFLSIKGYKESKSYIILLGHEIYIENMEEPDE